MDSCTTAKALEGVGYEGTEFHNSAAAVIKNSEREEEVATSLSVGDPRGGFVMESRVNETGHHLSVPTDEDSLPHVDDMEKRGTGLLQAHSLSSERVRRMSKTQLPANPFSNPFTGSWETQGNTAFPNKTSVVA